ncbi:peptidoglycan editing factor PgeF [Methylophaga frappieri]|nr:peptidoglycan editing factor PgeF [Methylophaga frappieri]
MKANTWLTPDWPIPTTVRALTTTRQGGISQAPFDSLNLGDHVGDLPQHVQHNRHSLQINADLPNTPMWLQQTHSCTVIESRDWRSGIEADAIITSQTNQVCAILTADCLPILLSHRHGKQVAAIHAGWRGLANGIVEQTLTQLNHPASDFYAWLGPAIGPAAFEVGDEVRNIFIAHNATAKAAFKANRPGHHLADIYQLARYRLRAAGVSHIYGGQACTLGSPEQFFSYRRDGVTGRMASLIWITPE